MKVFVAGASGAIGRPLVRQLVAAGHEVTGTTRREERAEEIRAAGAKAVVCDALDGAALGAAVKEASPEVVVNQLTRLPQRYDPRKASFYEATNRLRGEGGRNLLEGPGRRGRGASSPRASPSYTPPKATGSRTRTPARSTTRRGISAPPSRPCWATSSKCWGRPAPRVWSCATGSSTVPAPTTPGTATSAAK